MLILTIAIFISLALVVASLIFSRGMSQRGLEQFVSYRASAGTLTMALTSCASVCGVWILFLPPIIGATGGSIAVNGYAIAQALPLVVFAAIGARLRMLMPEGHDFCELIGNRFKHLMNWLFIAIAIFYLFVFIVAELTSMARVMQELAGVPALATITIVAVSTCLYTLHGGLRSSIFTDGLQFSILIPIFTVTTIVVFGKMDTTMVEQVQEMLSITHESNQDVGSGFSLAIALILGVTAANIFHQGLWQRVYAAKSRVTARAGFMLGALLVIPLVMMAGSYGLHVDTLHVSSGSAVFETIELFLPNWASLTLVVIALMLAMSTVDSLISGINSAVITNISNLAQTRNPNQLLTWSRFFVIALTTVAALFSLSDPDLLYLFLFIDLICAGCVLPTLSALYSRYQIDPTAFISAASGVFVGFLFFPTGINKPSIMSSGFGISYNLTLALSFAVALLMSGLILFISSKMRRSSGAEPFDFSQVKTFARKFV